MDKIVYCIQFVCGEMMLGDYQTKMKCLLSIDISQQGVSHISLHYEFANSI